MVRLLCLVFVTLTFIYTIESAVTTKPTGVGSSSNKLCGPVKCPGNKQKQCAYGYQKKDGCEICKCNDPCNPPGKAKLCGPNQRCFVDKKPDGTFGTRCDVAPSRRGGKGGKGGKDSQTVSKADCNQPKLIGSCRAALPRFYYNAATKTCEQFNYGGCQGNANNFQTKLQCEAACKA